MALELTEEQIKAGWTVQKLGNLCTAVISGGTPNRKNADYYAKSGEGIPWVKTQEIRDGRIYATEEFITELGLADSSAKIVPAGAVLIAMYGATVGRIGRLIKPMATNQAACSLVVNPDKALADYIYYVLFSVRDSLIDLANGAAQQNLNLTTIRNFEIAVPPLDEQERTAEILGSLDDKIEANNALLNSLDEYLRLDYVASINQDKDLRTVSDIAAEVREGVSAQEIDESDVYVGLEHLPRRNVWLSSWGNGSEVTSNKSRFKKGDILFGKLRPYFHKVVVAPVDGVCSTDIIVVRPKPGFEQLALQVLSSDAVIEYATNVSNGTRMPRAKWSDLKDFEVRGYMELKSVASFELAATLTAENRQLAETRDLLIRNLIGQEL